MWIISARKEARNGASMIGQSRVLLDVVRLIEKIARHDAPVLIEGTPAREVADGQLQGTRLVDGAVLYRRARTP